MTKQVLNVLKIIAAHWLKITALELFLVGQYLSQQDAAAISQGIYIQVTTTVKPQYNGLNNSDEGKSVKAKSTLYTNKAGSLNVYAKKLTNQCNLFLLMQTRLYN